MSGYTEESARFKKATQTVGAGGNNELVGNTNDDVFKTFEGNQSNVDKEPRSADSQIERDLETKVRTVACMQESTHTQQLILQTHCHSRRATLHGPQMLSWMRRRN